MAIASERPRSSLIGNSILRFLVVACLAAAAWGAWLQPARVDVGTFTLSDRIFHPIVTNEHLAGFLRRAESIAVSSDGRVAMAIMNGADSTIHDMKLYRSDDGGARWIRLQTPAGIAPHQVALSADGRRALVLGKQGEILRTADAGATWAKHSTGMTVPESLAPALYDVTLSTDGMRGFVRARPAGKKELLLRTEDGGATWSEQPDDVFPLAMSADGLHVLKWSGRYEFTSRSAAIISRSTDGGRTWTSHPVPGAGFVMGFALSSDGRVGLVVDRDSVWRSDDGGETWSRNAAHLGNPNYLRLSPIYDGGRVVALSHAADGHWLHVSQDSGRTWVTTLLKRKEHSSYWNMALSADGLRGIMIGQGDEQVLRTSDGGLTWQAFASPGRSAPYWVHGAVAISLASMLALLITARRRAADSV